MTSIYDLNPSMVNPQIAAQSNPAFQSGSPNNFTLPSGQIADKSALDRQIFPPPLSTSFPQTPDGTKTTGIVTSKAANNHSTDMGNTITQANTDLANHTAFQGQQQQTQQQQQQAQNQQNVENQQTAQANMPDPATVALYQQLGMTPPGMTPDQQNAVSNDTQQISVDQQRAQETAQKINSIANGSYPLSATQQAQVNNIAGAYSKVLDDAALAAKNLLGGTTKYNAKGLQMYSPQEAASNIAAAVAYSSAKIATINSQLLDKQNQLTQSFQDGNYKDAMALYKSIGDDIKSRSDEIDSINKTITDAQTKLATSQAQNQKDINGILKDAAAAGAPDAVKQAIANAPDFASAVMAAGDYLKSSSSASGIVGEYQFYKQDAIAHGQTPVDFNTYQNIDANRKATAAANASPIVNAGGMAIGTTGNSSVDNTTPGYTTDYVIGNFTQAAIDQDALATALGQPLPVPLGLSGTGAIASVRAAINNRMAELNTNGNVSVNKERLKSLSDSLTTQVGYQTNTQRSLKTAEEGMQHLTDTFSSKGINASNIKLANIIANATKYNLSPENIASFRAGLQEVSTEYQNVWSRANGSGGITESQRKTAQDILDGNISMSALKAVSDELQAQGKIVLKNANSQVQQIQDQMSGIIGGAPASTKDVLINQTQDAQSALQQFNDSSPEHKNLIDALGKAFPTATPMEIVQKLQQRGLI